MKNILYLHAGAEMYGADKILLEIVKGLDKKKFHPIVVLPNDGILVKKLKDAKIETHIIDYPILRRKYFNLKGICNYAFQYEKKSEEIYQLIKNRNIEIIHVNTTAVLEGIKIKKKLNVKLIWHVHEIIVNPRIVNKYICFLLGHYADKIITVSDAVKNHLINSKFIKLDKIQTIYNGVDDNDIKLADCKYLYSEFNITTQNKVIGMIGRINSWKGQKDFVDAVVPILNKYKSARAIIVGGVFKGEEWRRKELQNYIDKTGVSKKIILSDFRSDTKNLFKIFDVFVIPSVKPDPLPTVVLEAMASSKPIVGYNHGGVSEMVVQNYNGILSTPREPSGLTESIDNLLGNESKLKEYGNNSLKLQESKFSIITFSKNFNDLYESI